MITKCPVCGKAFDVLWPQLWAYREGNAFICTWKCLRKARKEAERMESKRRDRYAVADEMIRTMEAGQDPIAFLKSLGYINPAQAYSDLRTLLKKTRPEMFKRLPENLKEWKKRPEIPEPVSGGPWEKMEVPEKITIEPSPAVQAIVAKALETPEKIVPIEKIDEIVPPKPLVYDGYTVRCIEGVMGRFYYDKSYDRLDWTTPEGEEVSFSPSAWQKFATEELPKVMAILGVEL